jgi:hypothetical protein
MTHRRRWPLSRLCSKGGTGKHWHRPNHFFIKSRRQSVASLHTSGALPRHGRFWASPAPTSSVQRPRSLKYISDGLWSRHGASTQTSFPGKSSYMSRSLKRCMSEAPLCSLIQKMSSTTTARCCGIGSGWILLRSWIGTCRRTCRHLTATRAHRTTPACINRLSHRLGPSVSTSQSHLA